jgi:hypothetical protein
MSYPRFLFFLPVWVLAGGCALASAAEAPSTDDMIRVGVEQLLAAQAEDGSWAYEGVYRVGGEIPVGYRIGGTAIVCEALLYAGRPDHAEVNKAMTRGLDYIFTALEHPTMEPSKRDAYDVRIWGHAYALTILAHLKKADRMLDRREKIELWIPRLVDAVLFEEVPGGGWNYQNHRYHAGFVTASVVQSLLLAKTVGANVPDEVLTRTRDVLVRTRLETGAFSYSDVVSAEGKANMAAVPGSIARSPMCEGTLRMLGGGSTDAIGKSIDDFFTHWDELEKRRKKTGTHAQPYGIAPYYFYYGHRYAAQAIELLPRERRDAMRARMHEVILKTRDEDGTWNDRVFPQSRSYGTAMTLLALLHDKPLMPATGG